MAENGTAENGTAENGAAENGTRGGGVFDLFHEAEGMKLSWTQQPKTIEELKTFEVRDDDVFLITYPKSGTHWIGEIVNLIYNNGDKSKMDRSRMKDTIDLTICAHPSQLATTPSGLDLMVKWSSPRIIFCHAHKCFLPPQVFEKKVKVIYLARNPKDLAVSYHKFLKPGLPEALQDWNAFVPFFLSPDIIGGPWFKHVTDYWALHEDPNFLYLKYEDMKKDLKGNVTNIAKFLEHPLTEEVLDGIVADSSFGGMEKSYQAVEEADPENGKFFTKFLGMFPFLRKGEVGGWKNVFTVAQNEQFDKVYEAKMKGTGLEFDFGQ